MKLSRNFKYFEGFFRKEGENKKVHLSDEK